MNRFAKATAALFTVLGMNLVSHAAHATCVDVNVMEVSAGYNGTPIELDVALDVKRLDNSTRLWTYVRYSSFRHTGVQRIERLATAALLAGKKLYLCWNDANGDVSAAYLK